MKKYLLLTCMITSFAFAEPSVYSREYAVQSKPYSSNAEIISLKQKINDMQEEIEGLKTMVESLSARLNRMGSKNTVSGAVPVEAEINMLKKRIDKLEHVQPHTASSSAAKKPESVQKQDSYLSKASSPKLFSRGVMLVKQKRYAEAEKRFKILLSRSYKPASSNFYMGEISYGKGRYDDAIKYYQTSAEKNENAAYMDKLLLHTAISLEKTGNKKQSKQFFEAIIDGYPGTSSAKEAKKHLH